MSKISSWLVRGGGVLAVGLGVAYFFRTPVMLFIITLAGAPPLADQAGIPMAANEEWVDDFYTVEALDPQTFAISEPRYFRNVYSYLLVGSERALLIDSGSPIRDISKVVAGLTDKPLSVISTHLHFDHVGNHNRFETILMPDLPGLKARLVEGRFVPEADEHLGRVEGFEIEGWPVAGWWAPGTPMDLGDRVLTLLSTPGHTPDSISIWEKEQDRLFMGDYAGDGQVYAFMPNTSLRSYLETTKRLIGLLPSATLLYAAHGAADFPQAPVTDIAALVDLRDGVAALRDGTSPGAGFWPRAHPINGNTVILTDWSGPGTSSWDFQ